MDQVVEVVVFHVLYFLLFDTESVKDVLRVHLFELVVLLLGVLLTHEFVLFLLLNWVFPQILNHLDKRLLYVGLKPEFGDNLVLLLPLKLVLGGCFELLVPPGEVAEVVVLGRRVVLVIDQKALHALPLSGPRLKLRQEHSGTSSYLHDLLRFDRLLLVEPILDRQDDMPPERRVHQVVHPESYGGRDEGARRKRGSVLDSLHLWLIIEEFIP